MSDPTLALITSRENDIGVPMYLAGWLANWHFRLLPPSPSPTLAAKAGELLGYHEIRAPVHPKKVGFCWSSDLNVQFSGVSPWLQKKVALSVFQIFWVFWLFWLTPPSCKKVGLCQFFIFWVFWLTKRSGLPSPPPTPAKVGNVGRPSKFSWHRLIFYRKTPYIYLPFDCKHLLKNALHPSHDQTL